MSRQMAKQLGDLMGDIEEAPAVSADDLSAWLGEPISEQADVQRAESVISFAFTLINKECGRSNAYWAAEGLPQDVRNVALQVAARGFQNPDSWANERLDDWGAGGRPVEELGMYLTATEKRILSGFAPVRSIGMGVINTYREDPRDVGFLSWMDEATGGLPGWYR